MSNYSCKNCAKFLENNLHLQINCPPLFVGRICVTDMIKFSFDSAEGGTNGLYWLEFNFGPIVAHRTVERQNRCPSHVLL